MHLSTKGRLAVSAMIDLAMREDSRPVSLSAISKRLRVSVSYLELLFGKLRRQRIVQSRRGARGGYSLASAAERITLADIVLAVDAPARNREPDQLGTGEGTGRVMTGELWTHIDAKLIEHMRAISLRDLADERRVACRLAAEPAVTTGTPAAAIRRRKGQRGLSSTSSGRSEIQAQPERVECHAI
jgi:Rrf2 family iron-sulfur cluster assembly transcriptional regulator